MFIQESSHGQSHSIAFKSVHDEHKPLLHVNSSEPSLSSNDVIANGSGKKARRQKHVHFSGTESGERAVRPPSSQSDERPTNNYEVGQLLYIHTYVYTSTCMHAVYDMNTQLNTLRIRLEAAILYYCEVNVHQIFRVWTMTSATMCLTNK